MRWTKVLRTGSVDAKFMAVDINTVMFTLEKGQDTEEVQVKIATIMQFMGMKWILIADVPPSLYKFSVLLTSALLCSFPAQRFHLEPARSLRGKTRGAEVQKVWRPTARRAHQR